MYYLVNNFPVKLTIFALSLKWSGIVLIKYAFSFQNYHLIVDSDCLISHLELKKELIVKYPFQCWDIGKESKSNPIKNKPEKKKKIWKDMKKKAQEKRQSCTYAKNLVLNASTN